MTSSRHPSRRGKLYVGITGHRPNRMPERHWDRIKHDLAAAMYDIEAAHPGRQIILLSGIAEGADRLAAFVALGREWKLRSVLAFHRTRFEEDFPTAFAVGEFRALLKASEQVYEPKRDASQQKYADDAYHAVGQRLLKLSEVLIAVWDGQGSRGKGGTVDVLEAARDKGIAVVWIDPRKQGSACKAFATAQHVCERLIFGYRGFCVRRILNNELYIGKLVWNRLKYLKNPESGRRQSRLNPP